MKKSSRSKRRASAAQPNKPLWKQTWARISGGIFAVLLTVAGFASKEFREAICLDLPAAGSLQYPSPSNTSTSFNKVASESIQSTLDGKTITFRARYYGETLKSVYSFGLNPNKNKLFMFLNLRGLDFISQNTPLGSTVSEIPQALILVPIKDADSLAGLADGTVVDVTGVATFLTAPEPGSMGEKLEMPQGQKTPLPDFMNFYVTASQITVIEPLNKPESRLMCHIFHDFK